MKPIKKSETLKMVMPFLDDPIKVNNLGTGTDNFGTGTDKNSERNREPEPVPWNWNRNRRKFLEEPRTGTGTVGLEPEPIKILRGTGNREPNNADNFLLRKSFYRWYVPKIFVPAARQERYEFLKGKLLRRGWNPSKFSPAALWNKGGDHSTIPPPL